MAVRKVRETGRTSVLEGSIWLHLDRRSEENSRPDGAGLGYTVTQTWQPRKARSLFLTNNWRPQNKKKRIGAHGKVPAQLRVFTYWAWAQYTVTRNVKIC